MLAQKLGAALLTKANIKRSDSNVQPAANNWVFHGGQAKVSLLALKQTLEVEAKAAKRLGMSQKEFRLYK